MAPIKLLLALSLFVASSAGAKVAAVSSSTPSKAAAAVTSSSSSSTPPVVKSPTTTSTTTRRTTTSTTPVNTPTTTTSVPATSVPVTTSTVLAAASSVSPVASQVDCNPAIATATPDAVLPTCPGGCTWPALDKPPPVASEWLTLFDTTQVPPAPLNGLDANGDVMNTNGYSATNDLYCTWTFTQCTRSVTDVLQCPQPNVWGLTYDDGPQPPSPILYNYMASVNQKVTMFIIGSRALEYPNTLLQAYQAGHQIAVHTWSHPYLTSQTTETIIAEIKWTEMVIKAITGVTPRYFRAPHGDIDDRVRYIVTALGYKLIQWDHDTEDWMLSDPTLYNMQPQWVDGNFSIWSQTDKNQAAGMITLEHELSLDSVCEAQKSYVIMRNAGWTPMPVADCLGDSQWYVEGGAPVTASNTSDTASASVPSDATATDNNYTTTGTLVPPSSGYSITASLGLGMLGVLVVLGVVNF